MAKLGERLARVFGGILTRCTRHFMSGRHRTWADIGSGWCDITRSSRLDSAIALRRLLSMESSVDQARVTRMAGHAWSEHRPVLLDRMVSRILNVQVLP